MLARVLLLTTPSSLFAGFIRRHGRARWKFSLWSFSVMKHSALASTSVLSAMSSRSAISLASKLFCTPGGKLHIHNCFVLVLGIRP